MPTPSGESDTLYDAQVRLSGGGEGPTLLAAPSVHWQHVIPSPAVQAAWQAAEYYSQNWTAHAAVPPAIPALVQQALTMSVNSSGYTVIDPAGQPVWPAVDFTNGLANATHVICGALIGSIVDAYVVCVWMGAMLFVRLRGVSSTTSGFLVCSE